MLPIITLEEHYLSSAAVEGSKVALNAFPPAVNRRLLDVGDERIEEMDKSGISLQVISHVPTSQSNEICQNVNDNLYKALQSHSKRFAGFAMLPMENPAQATTELIRCVKQLGFVGTLIPNHCNGRFYDDEFFWLVFEQAEKLNVPVYIHPQFATEDMRNLDYKGNYPDLSMISLSSWCWGWHSSTGIQILRLFASGFFDRYPRIKIVLGHMGEMLPYMIDRIIHFEKSVLPFGKKERSLREVWDNNIWVTTAGMFSLAPLACLLRVTKMERIMFSVDYPFEENESGMAFINEIKTSGLLNHEELAMLTYKNAEALLGIKASSLD